MLLWTEVVCSECAGTTAGEWAKWGKRSAAEIKQILAAQKWVIVGNDAYCPECCIRKQKEDDEENI